MKPLRLALISRRYWPLVGGAEVAMANLACQLQEMGHQVEIATAQWHPAWPRQIVHRGVPVTRIPNPPIRAWGTLRYMMSLGRWLRQHQGRFDGVYVSMLKHSATVAVTRFQHSPVPVVLRAEGAGESGDCHWQTIANFGMRIRRVCHGSAAVVAPSREIEQELLAAQYDRDKVRFIANGVRIGAVATSESRLVARENLAAANPALALPEAAPLVLYTGRLHPGKGLLKLVKTWPNVLARVPSARLYLVGEGPQEGELRGMISALGLQSRIILPGVFDNVEDLLLSANAFVLPSQFEGMSIALLEAMAAGLPVIASDIPGNRGIVEHGVTGTLFPLEDLQALADQIIHALVNPRHADEIGKAARESVAAQYSLETTAQQHVDLFRELLERQR